MPEWRTGDRRRWLQQSLLLRPIITPCTDELPDRASVLPDRASVSWRVRAYFAASSALTISLRSTYGSGETVDLPHDAHARNGAKAA